MKYKLSIVLFFIIACYTAIAQPGYLISGYVNDSITNAPVLNAEISFGETSVKSFTNAQGYFSVYCNILPNEIRVHCMSYNDYKSFIGDSQPIRIFLSHKAYDLCSVDIVVEKPRDLMPGIRYQIMDFEFSGNNLILLALKKQSLFSPELLLVDTSGKILYTYEINRPIKLYRDFDEKVFLITPSTAYEINTDSNHLRLVNPVDIKSFEQINNVIVGHMGNNYLLKQYMYNNQVLNYFNYDEINDSLRCFRTIADNGAIQRNRWGSYFNGREEDMRFQQIIMNRPVEAPLVRINDTIMVFNFLNSELEKYSSEADTFSEKPIIFHRDKGFSKVILNDKGQARIYFLFVKNGISQLKEIDTNDGRVIQTIDIPDFVYVEKIKVHNGIIYFLYKSRELSEYKKLYVMKI